MSIGSVLREMIERSDDVKTSDITDEAFLAVVHQVREREQRWTHVGDVMEALGAPRRVVLSKARKLIDRGLLDGCACGCRGDFEVTP